MRWRGLTVLAAIMAALSGPAMAEARWLACKYTDTRRGVTHQFAMMFDDLRNVAYLLDVGRLIEGSQTSITYQALRTRFPAFLLTYNRNDGALSVTPLEGTAGGILTGDCRRITRPAGAPDP